MIRLFIGIALPAGLRHSLAGLCAGLAGARWVEPENMHLTLRYVGPVDEGEAEDVDAALAAVRGEPAFGLSLSGIDAFGSGHRVRAVWAGVAPEPALVHLRDKVESACVRAGLAPEGRRFTPHVTLARLKGVPEEPVRDFIEAHGGFAAAPFAVQAFTLFESLLGRGGAHYVALRDYPLGGA